MSKEAATSKTLTCQPLRSLHLIDRRDFVRDARGNYLLSPQGEKQLNWQCACGKTSGHSADYKGGDFAFIYTDSDAKKYSAE